MIFEQLFGGFLFALAVLLGYLFVRLMIWKIEEKQYVVAAVFSWFGLLIGLIGFLGFGIMIIGHIPK